MGDSVKKYYEMIEEGKILSDQGGKYTVPYKGGPILSLSKKEIYDAFLFNLDCYDKKIIDKNDFINAMEEYIYE